MTIYLFQELEELWAFRDLLANFTRQLSGCCTAELLPLLDLPSVKKVTEILFYLVDKPRFILILFTQNIFFYIHIISSIIYLSYTCLLDYFFLCKKSKNRQAMIMILVLSGLQGRARLLYNAGYHTLKDIANANAKDLTQCVDHLPLRTAAQIVSSAKV